ncbi:phosphoglycerate mutase family protein [Vagococcus lutrae]|uniref:histidine phosphatase family protein n=2 Tax=Vagococcus lutrae TaxID=81947 RepID=UPI00201004E9|nr:histidine phosphatase family protein [Vagococcus lutrae]UQF38525.1 phosphoglycerate mutase family protein [Vagococcus lutrae]
MNEMKKWKTLLVLVTSVLVLGGCQKVTPKEEAKDDKKEETVLYVTRHGKTILNTLDRVQGWADTPLTKEGRDVAEKLGQGLKQEGIKFKSVYSSDLGRAKETARIVCNELEYKKGINEIEGLREASYGMFEGDLNKNMMSAILKENDMKSPNELMEQGMDMWKISANTLNKIDDLHIAEDADMITKRMLSSLEEISKKTYSEGGGNVLIVGHGMSISLLLDALDDSLPFDGHLANASVSKITYDGKNYHVQSIGDTSYIE